MPHPRHREAMERLTMLRVTSRHSALNASTLMALGGTDIAVASAEAKKTAVSELVVFSAPSAITANMRSRPEPRVITIVRLKPRAASAGVITLLKWTTSADGGAGASSIAPPSPVVVKPDSGVTPLSTSNVV